MKCDNHLLTCHYTGQVRKKKKNKMGTKNLKKGKYEEKNMNGKYEM